MEQLAGHRVLDSNECGFKSQLFHLPAMLWSMLVDTPKF